MASSHLIELDQLPTENLAGFGEFSLKSFEKAMLVRNVNGDFAIVKAKWTGFRQGVPPPRANNS